MKAFARRMPAVLADQFGPGGDGCEDLAQTLGIDGQCAHGHVPVFGCEYHLLDGGHLHRYELARAGARARGAVVEATGPRSTAPGVISRGFEVDDPQYQREKKERTRAGDGAEDIGLGCAFRVCLGQSKGAFSCENRYPTVCRQPRADQSGGVGKPTATAGTS